MTGSSARTRHLVLVTGILSLAICLVALPQDAGAPDAPDSPIVAPLPWVESLSGTALSLTMVPVPRSPGGDALWISAHEITWDLFDAFVYRLDRADPEVPDDQDALVRPSLPFVLADRGYGHAGHPVISVNHTAADAFCEWLSAKTGRRHRLPTEAEWERAASAGGGPWCGGPAKDLERHAWVRQNAEGRTHPVGSLAPNALGLFDVTGNAAEWCRTPDGGAVLRGGHFGLPAKDVGCATRQVPAPAWNASDPQLPKSKWWLADAGFAGFRVVSADGPAGN